MEKIFRQKNKAFTLVETLVAISIFTVSILSILAVLAQGISNTGYAKRKMVASYLAQEGIEYIRNMRDTYVLYSADSQTGWNNFNANLTDASACQSADGCYFNPDNLDYLDQTQPIINTPLTACGGSCLELRYDSATGKYNYATGANFGYVRKIGITQPSPNETKVSSSVSWTQGSGTYNMTFSESLFNWVE